jgi:hypothetical protein
MIRAILDYLAARRIAKVMERAEAIRRGTVLIASLVAQRKAAGLNDMQLIDGLLDLGEEDEVVVDEARIRGLLAFLDDEKA